MNMSKPTKVLSFNTHMSCEDLTSLKQRDPFSYYSIPGVRSAKILLKEIDDSTDLDDCRLARNCTSCPSRLQTSQPGKLTVKRSSCISFECHPDLILYEDLEEEITDDDDLSDDEEFDVILTRLSLNKGVDNADAIAQ